MLVKNSMSWSVMVICASVVMAACAGPEVGPEIDDHGDESTEAMPPVRDLGAADDATVRIPDTTWVLADAARSALTSYDQASGTVVFSRKSAGAVATAAHQVADPAQLRVGDIVVSPPTRVTPYGLMRRVTGVSVSPSKVEITTTEASIGDAVENTSVNIALPMEGGKFVSLVPGAEIQFLPKPQSQSLIGVGYDLPPWQWSLPAGFDFGTGGVCKLNQATIVNMSASARLGLEISGFNVSQLGVWGDASASSSFNVTCLPGSAGNTQTVASYASPVYVYWIGGTVPLVFQVGLALVAGVDKSGSVLTLAASWSENYEVGLGWKAGQGWGPWTIHNSTTPSYTSNGSGTVRVKAGPVFALAMYASALFSVYSWVDIGFQVDAAGAVYALPFLELAASINPFSGAYSGTLYGGLESGGAAGVAVDLSVYVLGWPLLGRPWVRNFGQVFPEIKKQLATFSDCRCQ